MADYTISLHNPKQDTDEEVAERVELSNLLSAEVAPDDPPTPVELAIASLRATPERHKRWSFRVRDDNGTLVAIGGTTIDPEHDDNPDLLGVGINVHPDHRGSGIAGRLLAELTAVAESEGRVRFISGTNGRVAAGEAFAKSVGAEAKSASHMNRLIVPNVDRNQLEQWDAEGPARAEDYELIAWDGPVPEEYMAKYVDIVLVMNTAPRDDLQINDFTLTPEEVREGERVAEASGTVSWTIVARRVSDGAWAGFHDVYWNAAEPASVYVGSTGVRPEHRGHALGKWLKAHMQLRIMDERPDVKEVRTGNADSNDAMLGINKAMGYEHWISSTTWELSVEQATRWLGDRGLKATAFPEGYRA